MQKTTARLLLLVLAGGLALALLAASSSPVPVRAAATPGPRVVILGFDGADPGLVRRYMAEGLMPHFQELAKQGAFRPLLPTNPPQTPVSWSTFATGLNPGRTEIFDFLRRRVGTYIPDFALAEKGKARFLLGKWNGPAGAALVGLLAGLAVLLAARVLLRRWTPALVAALVVAGGLAAGLARPIGRLLPEEIVTAKNSRKGTPFWTIAARNGYRVRIVRVPVTFPAEKLPDGSTMLSGLGVPDMRGRVGTPTYFTSDPDFDAGNNQFSLELTRLPARRGPMETRLIGPINYPFHVFLLQRERERWRREGLPAAERKRREKELSAALEREGYPRQLVAKVRLNVFDDHLEWEVSGRKGTLRPGEWSDWVVVDFPLNWLVDWLQPMRGMGRFKLISLDPEVELYFSPINFHPSCHPVIFSWPPDWAERLARRLGLFKTIGWAIDTWSYPSGVGGVDLFIEDMKKTVAGFRRIMNATLADPDLDMYVQIYYFTDRAGHMFWHELDPQHPLYDPRRAPKYEAAMREVYRTMDEIVGEAMEKIGPDTLFLVLSDHGFSSFRRQINYNTWLYKHGYLALKGDVGTRNLEQLFDRDLTDVNVFSGIDWSRTKAWAMGLGSIYINLVGREPQGIVMPGKEYEQLVREIKEGLEAEVDPATGLHPVYRVYTRDEIYHDYDPEKIPDLRSANIRNYRVSWQDTLGGISTKVFEDNDRVWSGDHCSLEPEEVRGILLVNRPLRTDHPSIADIAPSVLKTLGLEPDTDLDGTVIWDPRGK